ncbi:unnamed protein product, partial [Didymodactylos carnosus]
ENVTPIATKRTTVSTGGRRDEYDDRPVTAAAFGRLYGVLDLHRDSLANAMSVRFQEINKKIDKLCKSTSIKNRELEPYLEQNANAAWPAEMIYEEENLLEISATSYGDYGRRLMRIMFSKEELKLSVLPPARSHLSKKPLNERKFSFLN